MHTAEEIFGVSGARLAALDRIDPQTPAQRTWATTEERNEVPRSAVRALLDPQGSAVFWIGLAAILGLILISGQVRLEAAIGGRAGRR